MDEKLTLNEILNLKKANSIAKSILHEPQGSFEYKDIVQVLLLSKLEKEMAIESIADLFQHTGWLKRALSNIKNDMIRKEKAIKRGGKNTPVPLDKIDCLAMFATQDDPETSYIGEEKKRQNQSLLKAIIDKAGLSKSEKRILDLSREEYSSKEIATKLEISVDSVYTRRSEAKRKMRKAIEILVCDEGYR
jgi:RNA polymerase sigma factor (sigma-70 family)